MGERLTGLPVQFPEGGRQKYMQLARDAAVPVITVIVRLQSS
jgi:hypothetical protein